MSPRPLSAAALERGAQSIRRPNESLGDARTRYALAWNTDWSKTSHARKPEHASAAGRERILAIAQSLLGDAHPPVATAPTSSELLAAHPNPLLDHQMGLSSETRVVRLKNGVLQLGVRT